MPKAYFTKMIVNLRQHEEIMLYGNLPINGVEEDQDVVAFLESEYAREQSDYPYDAPSFAPSAALWAAKTVYVAAQLILYRENKEVDILTLLPEFSGEISPSAILSADLCLRFLPDMVTQLKFIDDEDVLIPHLERHLYIWHYSAINYDLKTEELDLKLMLENRCLHQMYIDRIIEYKRTTLAKHPDCIRSVSASLGDFTGAFWNEFKIVIASNE